MFWVYKQTQLNMSKTGKALKSGFIIKVNTPISYDNIYIPPGGLLFRLSRGY